MLIDSPLITGSFTVEAGPSGSRPTEQLNTGSLFFNTNELSLEVYTGVSGSEWQAVGSASNSQGVEPEVGADIEYLVVAGGGGGGARAGGGGGAGGYLSSSLSSIESGSSITVTVGAAGTAGTGGANGQNGGDGGDSSIVSAGGTSFTTVTSTGGGGGGGADASGATPDGGSGGGASYSGELTGGSGTVGQGFDGGSAIGAGSGTAQYKAGGGGGASEVGQDGNDGGNGRGGNGGDGLASNITGTSITRAGGGGGGTHNPSNGAGSGGSGGGGAAGAAGGKNTGTAGTANTGGGGGGGSTDSSGDNNSNGAAGGSGVVILAYPTGSVTGQGGVKTSRSDGYFVHQFNSSGTFTLGGSSTYPVANDENFDVITYTGNGANSDGGKVVTGLNFKPDLVFFKNLDSTGENWAATDSVTGFGKILYPNLTNQQAGSTDTYFTANNDGFDINTNNLNVNTNDYAAWCFKAGGAISSSNSDGSITSQVSANPAAGFSIVSYTGNNGSSGTIGHGLNSAPELIITKGRTITAGWPSMFKVGSAAYYGLRLNSINANDADGLGGVFYNSTAPTSTVYTVGGSDEVNDNYNYVSYCFHSVDGYQKVGTYEGTGTSGNTVTTGFRPKFILIKNVDGSGNWMLYDAVRDTDGTIGKYVAFNSTAIEADAASATVTPSETGFTLGNSNSVHLNKSGDTFMYLAVG